MMHSSSDTEINSLLSAWQDGDLAAKEKLFPCVYQELHQLAHRQLRKSWGLETLNTTALVHEVYLKLMEPANTSWANRAHFFAVSAKAMRQIIINYAEQKQAKKRGGDWTQVTFDEAVSSKPVQSDTLLAIDVAVQQLETLDKRLSQLVELRFYGGMTEKEIGCVLGVTDRTVRRDWRKAKALLSRSLAEHIQ